jgi:hypothetical protein
MITGSEVQAAVLSGILNASFPSDAEAVNFLYFIRLLWMELGFLTLVTFNQRSNRFKR